MSTMSGTSGSHYTIQATITQNSQSTANNTSNVTVKLQLVFDGSSYYAYTYDTTYGSLTIDGTTYNGSIGEIVYSSGTAKTITLMEKTVNVSHNSDGTKTLNVSGYWDTNTSKIGHGSCTASKTLTPISRKATISSAPNFNHGATETVTYSNPSGATIAIALYDSAASTAYASYRTCTGSSYTFTFTDAELDKIYKDYGSNTTLQAKVYLKTTIGGTNYYDSKEVTITFKGDQKTAHIKVSNAWKRGKLWVKVNGTWRKAIMWEKVNGTWRKCI